MYLFTGRVFICFLCVCACEVVVYMGEHMPVCVSAARLAPIVEKFTLPIIPLNNLYPVGGKLL